MSGKGHPSDGGAGTSNDGGAGTSNDGGAGTSNSGTGTPKDGGAGTSNSGADVSNAGGAGTSGTAGGNRPAGKRPASRAGGRDGKAANAKATPTAGGRPVKGIVSRTIAQEQRRRKTIVGSSIAGALLVIAGLIGFGLYEAQKPKKFITPAHATSDSTGIIAGGNGKVRVDMYVDYQCPICKGFESQAEIPLDQMIAKNQITLVYHPVAFLDRMSTTNYSTRAASSSGCASDMNQFLPYTKVLFANQPPENSAGLTDDQIIQLGGQVGIIDPKFARCVRAQKYAPWVAHVTDSAAAHNVVGTPTVLVNGRSISPAGTAPTPDELTTAVNTALGATPK
jgi:protein-disulfide isomerase